MNILLIEDDNYYIRFVKDVLTETGGSSFLVTSAESLSSGLDILKKGGIDVVLLDLNLPDSEGLDTLRRANAQAPDVPIVMLTGHTDGRLAVQAVQEGAQDYLVKGQNEISTLMRSIRYAIERKRSQEVLRASEARFRKVIEKNADAIIIVDQALIIRFINPAAELLLGHKSEELVGTTFGFPVLGGETTEINTTSKHGRIGIVEMRVVEIEWDGKIAYLASLRDITSHKQTLVELEQTRQHQLQMKDIFLSKVSHELRTPLSVIHQFTTILLDGLSGGITSEQHEYLGTIMRNVEQLRKMIDDLLEITHTEINHLFETTRAEPTSLTIVPQCLSVTTLINETTEMFKTIAATRGITLSTDVPYNLPHVYADPQRVRQILNNLINNAIKFTPGDGTIHVEARVLDEEPFFLCIMVADNGCGINPEESAKIFDYLYQGDNTFEESRKGLGIGLYICKELVSRHRGRIWVESQPGLGSTFFFTLPIFSLMDFIAPIIKPENIVGDFVGFITVEVFKRERRPLTRADEEMLAETWNVLKHCILPDKDLVLPRMGHPECGEVFFIVACSHQSGIEALTKRIQGQLSCFENVQKGDFSWIVSSKMVNTTKMWKGSEEEFAREMATNLEELVDKRLCKGEELKE
ncbi:MAG: ATP-binding protein [Thermodesulfobacteriota bacterium]|nr:ATP-binding protein [Thermodesulfobacteriota bacterium]